MNPLGLIFVAGGGFILLGSILNWTWLKHLNNGRVLIDLLGEEGARWFNALGGLALVILGLFMLAGRTPGFLELKR